MVNFIQITNIPTAENLVLFLYYVLNLLYIMFYTQVYCVLFIVHEIFLLFQI